MRKAGRVLALVAIAALASPALQALSHEADAAHAICPEHGELLHVPASGGGSASESGVWAGDPAREAHDHCELCWSLAGGGISIASSVEARPNSDPAVRLSALDEARVLRPLDYAPKSSPPV